MKNLYTTNKKIILVLLVLSQHSFYAQKDSIPTSHLFVIKTDVLVPVIASTINRIGFGLSAEYGFLKRNSFQLSNVYVSLNSTQDKEKTNQAILDYKFYITHKKQYTGFYSGVYLKYIDYHTIHQAVNPYYNNQNIYLELSHNKIGGGLIFGYQNYLLKHIVIDFLLGLGVRNNFKTTIIKQENIGYSDNKATVLDARLSLNIGYKF